MIEYIIGTVLGVGLLIGVIFLAVYFRSAHTTPQTYVDRDDGGCSDFSTKTNCPPGCIYANCSSGFLDPGSYACWNVDQLNRGKYIAC